MRSMIGIVAAVAILGAGLTAASARSDDFSPRCPAPIGSSLSKLMTSAPDAVVYEYRGRDAAIGIRIFNTLPPRGNDGGDRFYIAVRPAFPVSRLIVANHGCVADAMLVDVRVAMAIRKVIKQSADTMTSL